MESQVPHHPHLEDSVQLLVQNYSWSISNKAIMEPWFISITYKVKKELFDFGWAGYSYLCLHILDYLLEGEDMKQMGEE